MNILIACEHTGASRRAFAALGHNVWSCDLLPADDDADGVQHLMGDVRWFITEEWQTGPVGWKWDMMIAHPDCTFLCSSGLHWNKKRPEREQQTVDALAFVELLMSAPIPKIAIENPVGCISTRIDALKYGFTKSKATQYIQPHEYGHDASKRTGLWLKNLPALVADPDLYVEPRIVEYPIGSGKMVKRWGNQTDSGQNKLTPSPDRWKERSATYSGWSDAMAEQWGQH